MKQEEIDDPCCWEVGTGAAAEGSSSGGWIGPAEGESLCVVRTDRAAGRTAGALDGMTWPVEPGACFPGQEEISGSGERCKPQVDRKAVGKGRRKSSFSCSPQTRWVCSNEGALLTFGKSHQSPLVLTYPPCPL